MSPASTTFRVKFVITGINHIGLSFIRNFFFLTPSCIWSVPFQPTWRRSLSNCCPVGDDAQIREFRTSESTCWTRTCYMLKRKMNYQLSTSWILDSSRYISLVGRWTESLIFIAECKVTWKTSFIIWPWSNFSASGNSWHSFPLRRHFKSPWFHRIVIWPISGPPSSATAFRASWLIGSDGRAGS